MLFKCLYFNGDCQKLSWAQEEYVEAHKPACWPTAMQLRPQLSLELGTAVLNPLVGSTNVHSNAIVCTSSMQRTNHSCVRVCMKYNPCIAHITAHIQRGHFLKDKKTGLHAVDENVLKISSFVSSSSLFLLCALKH